jgi:hypothetical protein
VSFCVFGVFRGSVRKELTTEYTEYTEGHGKRQRVR